MYKLMKTNFGTKIMWTKVHEEPEESSLQRLKELVGAETTEEIINVLNKDGDNQKN